MCRAPVPNTKSSPTAPRRPPPIQTAPGRRAHAAARPVALLREEKGPEVQGPRAEHEEQPHGPQALAPDKDGGGQGREDRRRERAVEPAHGRAAWRGRRRG